MPESFLSPQATSAEESFRDLAADKESIGDDQLRRQIEYFSRILAPRTLNYRSERKRLYQALQNIPKPRDRQLYGEDTRGFVLTALWRAQQAERKRREASKATQTYQQERRKVERLLDQITESPIVNFAPSIEHIGFYKPSEIFCSHGKLRKRCLKEHPLVPQDIRDFDHSGPSWRPRRSQRGKPINDLHNFLLETAGNCLRRGGWSKPESCGFVAQVLVYCFGHTNPQLPDPNDASLALRVALVRQMNPRNGKTKLQNPSVNPILSSPYLSWVIDRPE